MVDYADWTVSLDQADAAFARFVRSVIVCRAKVESMKPGNGQDKMFRGGWVCASVSLPLGNETVFAKQVQPIRMARVASSVFVEGSASALQEHEKKRAFFEGHWDRRNKCFVVTAPSA